ncbi:hypothetical protein ATO6_23715, partial [Oceanicola sp. 22II-s10i]
MIVDQFASSLILSDTRVRIDLTDTSSNPNFPDDDWTIDTNSILEFSNGGTNRFFIQNRTQNTIPFTIAGPAPDNSLWVAGNGSIGLGTTLPQANLHIVDKGAFGEARIRLEDAVGTSYSWDMRGNNGGFYLYDVTAGKLPFQVRPGAPTSSIEIVSDGKVGIGTGFPQAALHLQRSNNTAALLIEETGAGTLGQLTLRN